MIPSAPSIVSPFVRLAAPAVLALLVSAPAFAQAGDPNECDGPGDSPNVIVGDLYEMDRWGSANGITAFSVGTYSCNVGTCWLDWITGGGENRHPTIGQNAFRLEDGRFEHVGQSWLKHGFYALSDNLCSNDCLATDGEHLGVNCADPYSAGLNGQQSRLGPKFEVNATTGFHPHPVTMQNLTGDDIFKRLQIRNSDMDPALHPTARYFLEGQYIAEDDARAGNQHDNASYREVQVVQLGGGMFDLQFMGPTIRTKPAILAWADADPEVVVTFVDDPDGGRFWLAAKATDLGGGTWRYEYAVQNLDSHRSAGWFSVPMAPNVAKSNLGFHDVDYHSGEPFDLTDWNAPLDPGGAMTWSTVPHATNPDANALRWGTLYNFRFDADAPPVSALVTLGLFRPGNAGDPRRLAALLIAPSPCDVDGTCDAGESCVSCPGECDGSVPDTDGDGLGWCDDCDDNDPKVWGPPTEALKLLATRGSAGEVRMRWDEPADPGSLTPTYEVLRSATPSDFATGPDCLIDADPSRLALEDAAASVAGPFLSYLVRANSRCVANPGTTGTDSFGRERIAADCP